MHPVLTELNLDKQPLTAVHLLNCLIETEALSVEVIRLAHRTLTTTLSSLSAPLQCRQGRSDNGDSMNGGQARAKQSIEDIQNLKRREDTTATTPTEATSNTNDLGPKNKVDPTSSIAAAEVAVPVRRRHVALRFYYDGGSYSGLAQNVGVDSDQSIERQLFAALQRAHLVTGREEANYSRCGRTDRGVSSAGQVVALTLKSAFAPDAAIRTDAGTLRPLDEDDLPKNSHDAIKVWVHPKTKKSTKRNENQQQRNEEVVEKQLSEYPYEKILNNLLPPDIRILGWSPVSDDFSARFSATTRTYRYFFVPRSLNLQRMQEALEIMVGTHDFRNLCRMDVEKVYNFERHIHSAEIVFSNDDKNNNSRVAYILIVGQAFLWHQIRCIASVLFLIGRGLEEPSVVRELLDVKRNPGKPSYPLADERPLVLHHCQYHNLHIGYSVSNLWNIVRLQEQQWEESILAAARVRNCIDSLQCVPVQTADLIDFYTLKQKQILKRQKGKQGTDNAIHDSGIENAGASFSADTISWEEALLWLKERGVLLDPDATTDFVYTPLMQRAKGTTYEEKVASIQTSEKRRQRYEENVIKKRKTKEEDAAFYAHKTQQGGSAR